MHYSASVGGAHYSRISYVTVNGDGSFDADSESIVLQFEQPATNHNGGGPALRPRRVPLRERRASGGGANDFFGHGQRADTLYGTILRLDVDSAAPYAIPPDNPFADGADGAPEVWARMASGTCGA